MGNLEESVIEMRTRVINDFCHKSSKFKYILDSEVFQVFLMNNVETKKIIDNLPQLSYEELLNRYQKAFNFSEENYDNNFDFLNSKEKIILELNNIKKALINLQDFKESVNIIQEKKQMKIEHYISLIHLFEDYEKYTLNTFIDNDTEKLVFFNPKNIKLCENILNLKKKIINPYVQMSNWLEENILDIEAMIGTLENLNNLFETLDKYNQEIKRLENEINSYDNNYIFNIKLCFSFKNKQTILNELNEQKNSTLNTIEHLKKIIQIAFTITEKYLEQFRLEQLQRYHKHIKLYSEDMKNNSDILNELWLFVSKDNNLKEIIKNSNINNNKNNNIQNN